MSPEKKDKCKGIPLIEGAKSVNGTVAYWWEPDRGDTCCMFGIKNGKMYYLENFSGPFPSSPDDEETIKGLILQLWKKGEGAHISDEYPSFWKYLRDYYDLGGKEFVEDVIALATEYGLTLKVE